MMQLGRDPERSPTRDATSSCPQAEVSKNQSSKIYNGYVCCAFPKGRSFRLAALRDAALRDAAHIQKRRHQFLNLLQI